jgi:hypothetical protein
MDQVGMAGMVCGNILRICLLEVSARMPWTTGNENFPSVKSSAKPLFEEYCKNVTSISIRESYILTIYT